MSRRHRPASRCGCAGQGLVPGLVVQRDAGSVLRKDRGLQRPQTSGLGGRVSLGDLAGLRLVVRQAVLDLEDLFARPAFLVCSLLSLVHAIRPLFVHEDVTGSAGLWAATLARIRRERALKTESAIWRVVTADPGPGDGPSSDPLVAS